MKPREPHVPETPVITPTRNEWLARALSGAAMAIMAIAGVAGGGLAFALIIALAAISGLREWHRLVNGGKPHHGFTPEMIVTVIAVVAGILFIYYRHSSSWPMAFLLIGAAIAGLLAMWRKEPVLFHAAGALYLGGPVLALVALRQDHVHGGWIVLGIFIAVWAADIGALFFGRLIGGPKLAPVLSPAKTWAGFLGGTILAALAEACYVAVLGGAIGNALIFGVFLAIAGHAGDLFESWVKRRFRVKNSGTLIPGHGGMLDRIDSLLFATPAAAGLVFLLGFDPLSGVAW